MEQTILNPKFLLSAILALSLTTISLSVFILYLYRRINTLCDYYNCMYGYINMINKA